MMIHAAKIKASLNIAYLMQSGFDSDRQYGPTTHAFSVLKELRSLGHTATLLTLQTGRRVVRMDASAPESSEVNLGISGSWPFKISESAIRFVQSRLHLPYLGLFDSYRFGAGCLESVAGCDILHERYSVLGLGGAWTARRLASPLVLEVHADIANLETPLHGTSLTGFQRWWVHVVTQRCFSRAARIVAVSRAVADRLAAHWSIPWKKIDVVPLGADVSLFTPRVPDQETYSRLGLGSENLIVMFVGSFQPWHGLPELVEAFAQVAARRERARLVLVGDGALSNQIRARATGLGLQDRVVFTGSVPYASVPGMLAVADVAVAPYPKLESELWFSPLKLFEYMAAGKAIVASDVGQISDVLVQGESGVLVEAGSVPALSQALLTLLDDRDARLRLGQNARRTAERSYSWEVHARALERIYQRVLEQRANSTPTKETY
jgi:glycosyltransferase involved in cell wall biosynthesis